MKRRFIILITVPFQKQIPAYVFYLASEIKKMEGTFYIAVNGKIDEKGKRMLQDACDQILLRKNEDYDIGAYREIILKLAADNKLTDYEELVLMNDSFYGPIYPFKDIFDTMENKDVDFWGLSAHPKAKVMNQYFIEEHLQSYFLVIRKNILQSVVFQQFWMNLPAKISSRELAIESFEKKFTLHFSRAGYSWAAYIDKSVFTNNKSELNYNPYLYSSLELIERYHFPILKRGIIPLKSMEHYANWDDAMKCLRYIDEKTGYDVGLIWDDLLQRYDVNMLKNYLHMNFIITSSSDAVIDNKLLIIVHGRYKQDQVSEYISDIGDVIWSTELSNFTMELMLQYSYICFLNFRNIEEDIYYCDKRTIYQNLIGNLVRDKNYVSNVINVFEENTRLGVLFTGDPYFSEIFNSRGKKEWKHKKCSEIKELTGRKGFRCIVTEEWMPEIGLGSFWCRSDIFGREEGFSLLSEILGQEIDRICCLPYLCQHYGYFTGEVISDSCASEKLCNYKYALSAITDASYGIEAEKLNDFHIQLCQLIMRPQIIKFCSEYDYIYVYGAGAYGIIFADLLDREKIVYEGFLVSKGQYKPETLLGKPVYYLDEVRVDADKVGILAAVSPSIQPVIRKLCEMQDYHNLYCFEARIANK